MAEPWIKMRTDLATNPKVVAIAELLNLDEDTVVGKMHRLWSWADKHAKDGRAMGSPAWLDRMMKCKGLANALMREEIDWLQAEDGWLVFPRWEEHNSQSAKSRAEAARRQRTSRENRTPVTESCDRTVTGVTDSANTSATRGEERRREKRRTPPAAAQQSPSEPEHLDTSAPSPDQQQAEQQQDSQTGQEPRAEVPRCQGDQVPSLTLDTSTPHTSTPSAFGGSSTHLSPARSALLAAITATGATGSKPRQIVAAAMEADVAHLAALVREFREQVRRDKDLGRTVPGPGLLLARLDEYLAADENTEAGAAIIAHATDLTLKYDADDRARAARTAAKAGPGAKVSRFQGDKVSGGAGSTPRHLNTSTPPSDAAVVPGITDHPAFARLAGTADAAPSNPGAAAPRQEIST